MGTLTHELVFRSPIERTNLKINNCHNNIILDLAKSCVQFAFVCPFVRVFFSSIVANHEIYEPLKVIEVALYADS